MFLIALFIFFATPLIVQQDKLIENVKYHLMKRSDCFWFDCQKNRAHLITPILTFLI